MINEFETKAAVKHTRYNSIQEEIKRYHQQQEESAAKLKAIEEELSTQVPEKEKAENELQRLRQLRGELEDNIRLSENRQKELNQVLQAESRKLDARHNEYQLTKNLLEQMEGYPESIRYLKKSNDKFKQAPLLSDIIVCEEPFKVAIENFLEPYLNHFVVDTMQDAWEALESLSSSAKGRANFFVLESLKQFQGKNANAMEGCTPALSAVERNGKYDALYAMLLSHVYILDKDRSLQDYHIGEEQSLVVLSQTGNFLRQKYAVGGGSIGAFDGKRTGKFRNLEKLAEEMQHQEKVVEEYKEQVKLAETELVELKSQLDQTRQSLSKQESDFMRLNGQVNSLQSNAQFLSNNLEQSKNNSKRLEDEATGIQRLLEEEQNNPELSPALLRERLDKLVQQLNVQQEQTLNLQRESNDKSQSFNQQNITLLQQQNRIQNIIRDIGYKTNQSETLTKNKEQYAVELETVKTQTDTLLGGLENNSEAFKLMLEEKASFEEAYKETEAEYTGARAEIESEEKRLHELRRNKESADHQLQSVHDELNELKLQMHTLKERLNIEFNIDIQDLSEQEPDPEFNEEEMRPRAEQLRKRVAEFGPINPMALEQYKEIKERYDFIISEKTDLQNAKEALLKTISEIDETARTVFMEAFIAVRTNFIRVFRSLFTDDDNCDLVLSDQSNPLESDIQIIAQPKGKKPLSIHQLSGGEKTLTATALLFGIYLLKPAPFCIFDEVDAPLDDNNVDKFNNIIKTFSNESQFIIITHNKKTMAATDIMYGITMAEPGVTTVVPVDMRMYA
jgi:chromosome segregation protein